MQELFITPRVQHYSANTVGRDFVIGDLHGCRSLLDFALDNVSFDTRIDRLFSVGDLVDRGPSNEACLALLDEPWFYPVMGNHDAMLLAAIYEFTNRRIAHPTEQTRKYYYGNAFGLNGGMNWFGTHVKDISSMDDWAFKLEKMPLIATIGEGMDRFNLIHADLFAEHKEWTDTDIDTVQTGDWARRHWVQGMDENGDWVDHVMWGRELRYGFAQSPIPYTEGLSKTYAGHTITVMQDDSQIATAASHVFLDTGAYNSKNSNAFGLTLWNHTNNIGFKYSLDEQAQIFVKQVWLSTAGLKPSLAELLVKNRIY
jgi:serine/threonine protein phosphatase 1